MLKNHQRKITLLQKASKVFSFRRFFSSSMQRVQPYWVRIEKIIIPYLRYPKFKQWENLILQLQPRLQGSFLPELDSTCLNDSIVIKETFYPFFFLWETFLYSCVYDDNVQIWRAKLQYTRCLKSLAQLLYVIFFLLSGNWKKKVLSFISKINSNICHRWKFDFFDSNIRCFEYLRHVHRMF